MLNMLFATDNSWIMLVVLGVLIVALLVGSYVMQKRNKKKVEEVRSKLTIGDVVITMGGIKGVITNINDSDETVDIKTGENSIITIFKAAIQHINPQLSEAAKAAAAAKNNEVKKETVVEEKIVEKETVEVEPVKADAIEEVVEKEETVEKTTKSTKKSK